MRTFLRNNHGSFTIEAAMVFPIIFMIIVSLLFISIFFYQQATLYMMADETARRAALIWDNSHKHPVTGRYNPMQATGSGRQVQNDGLYWRFGDYNVLDLLLRATSSNYEPIAVTIGRGGGGTGVNIGSSLSREKMTKVAATLPEGIQGSIEYHNLFYKREIRVVLEKPLKLPAFVTGLLGKDTVKVEASAYVSEPVEFIRSVDFIVYSATKLFNRKASNDQIKGIITDQSKRK